MMLSAVIMFLSALLPPCVYDTVSVCSLGCPTVLQDLGNSDLKREEAYLVCKIIRIGTCRTLM